MIVGGDLVEDLAEELGALLGRVEAGGPEEDRRPGIDLQSEGLLEAGLAVALALDVVGGSEVQVEVGIGEGIEVRVGGVEDPGGAAGVALGPELVADVAGDEVVASVHHFGEEGGRDGIDEVGGEDAGGEEVDRVVVAGFLVVVRRAQVVEVLPEVGGIDSAVLDVPEGEPLGVDVVDREEGLDAVALGDGRDEPGHPVVAVDEVRPDLGDGVVDDLALEGEG